MAFDESGFVNGCRNIVLLAGYVRREEDGSLVLLQSANPAMAFPFELPNTIRRPPPNEAVEVRGRLYSERNEEGERNVWLRAMQIRRASVSAADVTGNPFASREEVMAELQEQFDLDSPHIELLLTSGHIAPGRGGFLNRVVLSGFVGHKRFIEPAEGSWDDFGSLKFELHQSPESREAHIITLPGAGKMVGNDIGKRWRPIVVDARLKVSPVMNDEGAVIKRTLFLESHPRQIRQALRDRDFLKHDFPAWFWDIVRAQPAQATAASPEPAPAATPRTPVPSTFPTEPNIQAGVDNDEAW